MVSELKVNDRVIVSRLAYDLHPVHRGTWWSSRRLQAWVRRITRAATRDLLVEPYLPRTTATSDFGPVTVPRRDMWVMGDNRGDSEDSRYLGPVPESSVVGRAIWRVWPPWRLSFL